MAAIDRLWSPLVVRVVVKTVVLLGRSPVTSALGPVGLWACRLNLRRCGCPTTRGADRQAGVLISIWVTRGWLTESGTRAPSEK